MLIGVKHNPKTTIIDEQKTYLKSLTYLNVNLKDPPNFDDDTLIPLHQDPLLRLDNKKHPNGPHLNLKVSLPHVWIIFYDDNDNDNNNNVKYYDSYHAVLIQCYHACRAKIDNDVSIPMT